MKVPPKPKRGKRSPFYWWRRWKSHQYLPVRASLLAKIQNGDFDYPVLYEWAKYELHYMQEELDEFVKNYQGNEDPSTDYLYCDIEKRYMKRYNKLIEDAYEVEQRHLTGLVDGLFNEFILSKDAIREIMEEFGGTAEELYHYIEKLQVGVRSDSDAKQLKRLRQKYGLQH